MKYFTTCPRDCYDTCSIITEVNDSGNIRISGNGKHPITCGFLCLKGQMHLKLHNAPDRLKRGIIRSGGREETVSSEEAVNQTIGEIEYALNKYGPGKILFYEYAGNMGALNHHLPMRLGNNLGALFIEHTICNKAGSEALKRLFGTDYGTDPEKIGEHDLIVYWGMNPKWTNLHGYALSRRAKDRRSEIVVVDAYKSPTAEDADIFYLVKPGSDCVLAIAMANHIINEKLASEEIINTYTENYQEYYNLMQKYTLEAAEKICNLKANYIREFAEKIASSKFLMHIGFGLQRNLMGGEAVSAIGSLITLLGRPYSFIYNHPSLNTTSLSGEHRGEYVNPITLADEIIRKDIKLIFVYGSNPFNSLPNVNSIKVAVERTATRIITHDLFMTDTAKRSNIVIPAASIFEFEDVFSSYYHDYVSLNQKIIDPCETYTNTELTRKLAEGLKIKDETIFKSDGELISITLKDNGIDAKELYEKGFVKFGVKSLYDTWKNGFNTASGKVVFPKFIDVGKLNLDMGKYQLLTVTHFSTITSQYVNIHSHLPDVVMMNSEDARRANISNGESIFLVNSSGKVKKNVAIKDTVPSGILVCYKGGWDEKNINQLTSNEIQADYGGASAYHSTYVQLEKTA